ncbi:nitroreductase family protein [Actinoplanes sp. N902-109]|uniref:nitroreductase family protein n=1 Tax=Actinoplanes sp. (strain N902-109) TaxID=649831 RepID=UPI001E5DE239|nr:nitroreductase family protein [Actinoplanes sp. N902-109]
MRDRLSPAGFDRRHTVSPEQMASLIEAARWAPSAGNSQPWSFLVAMRGDPAHERLVRHLARSSARWAPDAGALVVNLAHRYVAGTDWEYSEFALYDLGQAVAHLTVQAAALGLHVRQFRAFDLDGIVEDFAIPDHWQVISMAAVGHAGSPPAAGPARERRPDIRWRLDR